MVTSLLNGARHSEGAGEEFCHAGFPRKVENGSAETKPKNPVPRRRRKGPSLTLRMTELVTEVCFGIVITLNKSA